MTNGIQFPAENVGLQIPGGSANQIESLVFFENIRDFFLCPYRNTFRQANKEIKQIASMQGSFKNCVRCAIVENSFVMSLLKDNDSGKNY